MAVIDTGSTTHPDLGSVANPGVASGRWVPGYDFVSQDDVNEIRRSYTANDGDGRDANPADAGDWITAKEDAGLVDEGFFKSCGESSSSWHGTHVAGTIGATLNNEVGVAGILATARIQPVRVLGKCGGYTDDIAAGITSASGGTVQGVLATQPLPKSSTCPSVTPPVNNVRPFFSRLSQEHGVAGAWWWSQPEMSSLLIRLSPTAQGFLRWLPRPRPKKRATD